MIKFIILLAISHILVPIIAIVFTASGAVIGLWFAAFMLIGIFQLFMGGWKE